MADEERVATDEEIEMVRGKLDTVDWTTPLAVWLRKLLARYDADAERIDELERVTGPVMPCGCYAVECVQLFGFRGLCEGHFRKPVDGALLFCRRYGLDHTAANPMEITPEYLAWKESR